MSLHVPVSNVRQRVIAGLRSQSVVRPSRRVVAAPFSSIAIHRRAYCPHQTPSKALFSPARSRDTATTTTTTTTTTTISTTSSTRLRSFSTHPRNLTMADEIKKALSAGELKAEDPKARLQEFLGFVQQLGASGSSLRWAVEMQKDLEVVDAKDDGTIVLNFKVSDNYLNMSGFMHGGFIAVMFDIVSTMSLLVADRKNEFNLGGVSRSLDVSYLRPVPRDSVVVFESQLLQKGRTTSYMYATAKSKETGKLLATASHHKLSPKM